MKPLKKKTAKAFIILIVIAAVIGALITFVPMPLGDYYYTSLIGSINQAADLGAGVYAEYDLKEEYSASRIKRGISTIQGVLEENGYPNSTIYSLDNNKLRVEIGYPNRAGSLRKSNTLLSALAVGTFELRSSSAEEDTFIVGKDHIKSVELNNYNDSVYVVLNFNKAGEKAYGELLEATQTIYVCMGGEVMTSFSSENASKSSSLPLSFTDYASAKDFAMRVKLGSMDIELNQDTIRVDTMSNFLTSGKMTANPSSRAFGLSIAKVIGLVAIAFVIILGLAYMIIKHGVLGGLMALALLFDAIIVIAVLAIFPWVEISFSSLIAVAFGIVILLTSALMFMNRFEEEFKQGKTIAASLETGFKRSVAGILATGITLTVIFAIVTIVASAELKVFGLITCIFSALSLFSSLVMLPGFVKIFEAFNDGAIKPYRLKEREEEV